MKMLTASALQFWQDFFITAAHVPVSRADDNEGLEQPGEEEQDEEEMGSLTSYTGMEDPDSASDFPRDNQPQNFDDSEYSIEQGAHHRVRSEQAHYPGDDSSQDGALLPQSAKFSRASSPPRLSNASQKAVGKREAEAAKARTAAGNRHNDVDASWAALESPFERLRMEVQADRDASMSQAEVLLAKHRANRAAREQSLLAEGEPPTTSKPAPNDEGISTRSPAKIRAGPSKLLTKVLNAEQRKVDSRADGDSPGKALSLRSRLGGDDEWDGIADLRKTPRHGPSGKGSKSQRHRSKKASDKNVHKEWEDNDDDDSFAWPAGMSPPVTMQFSVPKSKYAKTPAKEAARLLVDDLLRTAEAGPGTLRRERERKAALQPNDSAVKRTSAVGTPLKKGPLGRIADGPQKRRDSMPTPPTLTKYGSDSRPAKSSTPAAVQTASNDSPALGSATAANKRSAMLLDEGEDEGEATGLPELGTASATPDLDSLLEIDYKEGDDEDDDEESESDSESDDEDEMGRQDLQDSNTGRSISKLSTFSASRSGWSSTSEASSARRGAASLDNDTLFGVGKSARPMNTSMASADNAGGNDHDFRMIGRLEDTVQGGKLLADKDVTYSAPSPTPWK